MWCKTPRADILWPEGFPVVKLHKQTKKEIVWRIAVVKLIDFMHTNNIMSFNSNDLRREMQTIERQWDRCMGERLGLDAVSRKEYND